MKLRGFTRHYGHYRVQIHHKTRHQALLFAILVTFLYTSFHGVPLPRKQMLTQTYQHALMSENRPRRQISLCPTIRRNRTAVTIPSIAPDELSVL